MARPIIVPAILSETADALKASMSKCAAFTNRVQMDFTDGTMTSVKTVGVLGMEIPQGVNVDLHMIVLDPAQYVDGIVKLKPSLVIFHAEAQGDLLPVFTKLRNAGIKTGVAFLKQTYPGAYKGYIEAVDHVLIFAGELGKQGATADLLQTEKVRIIRAIRKDVEIGWDGGATLSNVRTIFQAGITVINVGKSIAVATNPAEQYNALLAEAEKLGVM